MRRRERRGCRSAEPFAAPSTLTPAGPAPDKFCSLRLLGNVTKATLCVRGFDALSARSIYTYSIGSQQSHVEIDGSDNTGMTSVQIDDIYGEGAPRLALIDSSATSGPYNAEIASSTGGTPRVRYQLPFSIKAWRPITVEAVPAPGEGEAILWMDKDEGHIKASIGTATGTRVITLALWSNASEPLPSCP